MSNCPVCNKNLDKTALVELLYTHEPIEGELVETCWHKTCFIEKHLEAHYDAEQERED